MGKILLLVSLIVLGVLLLLILTALLVKWQLIVLSSREQTQVRLKIGWIPVSILLFPRKEKKSKPIKKKNRSPTAGDKPAAQKCETPDKGLPPAQDRSVAGSESKKQPSPLPSLTQILEMLGEGAGLLRRMFVFERLECEVYIATADAARTGTLLGAASAGAGMLLPTLQSSFLIRRLRLIVDADFEQTKTRWQVDIRISTRLIVALVHGLSRVKTIKAWIKDWKTLEKENQHEHTSHR